MTLPSPFLSIDSSCDRALLATKTKLSQAGFSTVQTFSLTTARLGLNNCCCPHHGTEACDCQMIILLVYGEGPEPVTLVLHGNDGQTWISVADSALPMGEAELTTSIRRLLAGLTSTEI